MREAYVIEKNGNIVIVKECNIALSRPKEIVDDILMALMLEIEGKKGFLGTGNPFDKFRRDENNYPIVKIYTPDIGDDTPVRFELETTKGAMWTATRAPIYG